MKSLKYFILSALLMVAIPATASVTLNTPYTMGNTSAGYVTCMSYNFDWNSQPMSVTYRFGTPTVSNNKDTAFAVTPGTPVITKTPTQIAGAISAFTGPQATLRNFADQFLMGVLPGTQVDTW